MEKNQINQPLKIVALTILFTLMLSLLPKNLELFGIKFKHVNIISELISSGEKEKAAPVDSEYENYLKEYQQMLKQSKDTTQSGEKLNQIIKDQGGNILIAGFNFWTGNPRNESGRIKTSAPAIVGNLKQLNSFYDALKNSNSKKIRIAHFGDSGIEGDLITADLRERLQKIYGGRGVGFLSITSEDNAFRISTKMNFSTNWKMYSLFTNNPHQLPLGIAGTIFIPHGVCWAEYKASNYYRHTNPFKTVKLFYSNSNGRRIKFAFNNQKMKSKRLSRGSGIQEITLKFRGSGRSFKFQTERNLQARFYGLSFESGNGIYVDNFPLRGNSGVDINKIPTTVLKDFSRYLRYNLIILEFGLNALPMIQRNYNWYVTEMVRVIKHLKQAYPKASFLLIGAQDKSIRKNGRFVTDPLVFKLLKAQLEIVKRTNIAFWNLFEAMGGRNSMHKWVTNNPPLASYDHIHFNLQGASTVARLLTKALIGR